MFFRRLSNRASSVRRTISLWAAVIAVGLPATAIGQTSGTWIGTGATGNWSGTTNWDLVPGNGGVASFGGGAFTTGYIGANVTITQDVAGLTLSGMNFNNVANQFSYTISGTNAITFVDPGSGSATIAFDYSSQTSILTRFPLPLL